MSREKIFSVTLADCDVQTFRSGGKGGQNQNKRDTGVRIKHRDSGAIGESREQRSQLQNKRTAFKRMTETGTFKMWLSREILLRGQSRPVDSDLLVEVKRNGQWVPE